MISEPQLSEVLVEFARTMVTDFSIQGILDHFVARVVDVIPVASVGAVFIPLGVGLPYSAVSEVSALGYLDLQADMGEGPRRVAYRTGQVVVTDLLSDHRFSEFAARARNAGLASVLTFPLRYGDRQLGVLELYQENPGAMLPEAMTTAQRLADVAAVYLFNAQTRAELQVSSDRSRDAALHDALTGLPNRALMLERLEHAFARARRSGKTSAVLFVDLDRFKDVNDTHGHRVGDELLVAVAERMSGLLRPGDTLARLSGDEFVILCEDLDSSSEADSIAVRVGAALGTPFVLGNADIILTVSIGIAFADQNSDSPEDVLDDADAAMYRAKRAGGGRHRVFDARDDFRAGRHQSLADERHRSLADELRVVPMPGEMRIEYQPIVDTLDGRITGVEALLRWMHPTRGMVSPIVLVPLADQSGLIPEIGQWVLEQACRQQQRWHTEQRVDELSMSVNVSAAQLMSARFIETVAATLESAEIEPRLLTVEVTESIVVQDAERALVVLHDLKDLGVMLALDDFRTGLSSLSFLKRFPVDILKIDPSFIAELGRDTSSQIIVGAIVELAHDLRMLVIAEGVETAEQYRQVARLGCDSYMGYYFALPMSATKVGSLLETVPATRSGAVLSKKGDVPQLE